MSVKAHRMHQIGCSMLFHSQMVNRLHAAAMNQLDLHMNVNKGISTNLTFSDVTNLFMQPKKNLF